MNELESYIRGVLRTHGPISVARFMSIALQHPDHGYYVSGDPLGKQGDFVTAPEVNQMFGEMIGVWLAFVWKSQGRPDPFTLLELGPGRGTLMADLLRATGHVEGFHRALRLFFLESNKTLRTVQAEKLAAHAPTHIEALDELPDQPLFAVANEFFDVFPVHQYKKTPHGWREIMVALEGDKLCFMDNETPVDLPLPEDLPFFEIAPESLTIARALATRIAKRGGAALILDYGYDRPPGHLSLQAVTKHKPCHPLEIPGQADLTAHVDFSALRHAAVQEGAVPSTVVTQGDFLRAMGVEIRADALKRAATPEQSAALDDALFRLLDESQMGTLFKVMALSGRPIDDMPGFP